MKLMFLHPHWEGCITITWIIWENILLCPVLTWTAYLHPLWVNFMGGSCLYDSLDMRWAWKPSAGESFPIICWVIIWFSLTAIAVFVNFGTIFFWYWTFLRAFMVLIEIKLHRSDLSRVLQLIDFSTSLPNLAGFW